MHRRVPLWTVSLVALMLAGVVVAQGYQPNFIRNLLSPIFTGPATANGDLTVNGDAGVTGNVSIGGTLLVPTVKAGVVDGGTLYTPGPLTALGKSTLQGVNSGDVVLDGGARLLFNAGSTHIESDGFGGVQGAFGGGGNFTGNFGTTGDVASDGYSNPKTGIKNTGSASACSGYTTALCINDLTGTAFADGAGSTVAIMTDAGFIGLLNTDSTGSPGAATINKASGRSAVAAGAASVVITNAFVKATHTILITPMSSSVIDCAGWYISTVSAGSFTLTCPGGNVIGTWKFAWAAFEAL